MKNKLLKIFTLLLIIPLLSGCFKRDDLEDIDIYTTYYPIKYLTKSLYGDYSNVLSIYPSGVDPNTYELTDKQITKYAKNSGIFIYNGLSNEKQLAAKFINKNNDIKIIDVSQGLTINNSMEELWLSPTNYLMMAQNIKNSLKEYISSNYIKDEIDKNYDELKLKISEMDAELTIIAENTDNKTIIVDDPVFKFLEKYGFEVVCLLNENNEISVTSLNRAVSLLKNKDNLYIFVKEGKDLNSKISDLDKNTNGTIVTFKTLYNLTEDEANNGDTYISIMNSNIEKIRNEMYKK